MGSVLGRPPVFRSASAPHVLHDVEWERVDGKTKRLVENLKRSIEELEPSIRSYNCLKNADIKSIGKLVQKSEGEMLKTKNFGRKSLDEIKEILSDMGLSFGMRFDIDGRLVPGTNTESAHSQKRIESTNRDKALTPDDLLPKKIWLKFVNLTQASTDFQAIVSELEKALPDGNWRQILDDLVKNDGLDIVTAWALMLSWLSKKVSGKFSDRQGKRLLRRALTAIDAARQKALLLQLDQRVPNIGAESEISNYELKPMHTWNKSFNKKAWVTQKDDLKILYSYGVRVAACNKDAATVYTLETVDGKTPKALLKHVIDFLRQNNFTAEDEDQIRMEYMK